MRTKARLGGKLSGMPNMAAIGAGGTLLIPRGHMGCNFGSTSKGGGGSFQVTPDLIRVIDQRSYFGTMYDVERQASRQLFQLYIALRLWRMHLWLLIWIIRVAPFTGISTLSTWLIIGKLISRPLSIPCCFLSKKEEEWRTSFGRFRLGKGFFMLDFFTRS